MVSAWKMDDTITVFLTAVEMCEADRCLPWQWQFFPKLEASHGGWHCHPACWAASQQPKSVTAQGTRWQPHPAGACSADPWRQQRRATTLTLKLMVCPYWCACKFGILGEKNWRACLWQSFLMLFAGSWQLLPGGDRGFSCPGVLGSLKWVLGVYRLPGWKHLLGLSCSFTRANAGVCLRSMGEVESRREVEICLCTQTFTTWRNYGFVLLWDVVKGGSSACMTGAVVTDSDRYCCWATLSLAKTCV